MKSIFLLVLLLLEPVNPAGIVSFTATPRSINAGESSRLEWMTRGVDSIAMEWGPAARPRDDMERRIGLPPVGTLIVRPEEDTVYVIECEGGSGQVCTEASATVRVKKH